ncbi:cystathionine beta-lyase [Pelagibius litoralis]|uniref:Cystathionine beta-lyase n=2 Tax=Pelagibius litoralis TaxID=374515 RepID=A0A967C7W0_9PROT|nr:cystathionine beta-lyase [Pelagibius litoralis]
MTEVVRTVAQAAKGFDSLSVPTYRGSTITFPDYKSFSERGQRPRSSYSYGLAGTPTTRTLQNKLTELEGAEDTFLTPSGLMAVTVVILAVVKTGDVVLLPDNVYPPVRRFAATTLAKLGVGVRYYDPLAFDDAQFDGAAVRLVWIEAPGSTTMEIPDIRNIAGRAAARGALVGCDNSWASPVLCRPLALGADIVVEAVTKYLSGHSDVLLGSISVRNEALARAVHDAVKSLGVGVSPDDCFLALRGIETAAVRLERVGRTALELAKRLGEKSCVAEVLHPALPDSPHHALWQSQFQGASGLFSLVLADEEKARFAERFKSLTVFHLGASWGGTHSVLAPVVLDSERSVNRTYAGRKIIRISAGLESYEDLLCDIETVLA